MQPCCCHCLVAKLCPTLLWPLGACPAPSHGISQKRILEWVAISFFRWLNLCLPSFLHWQADSLPRGHQESPAKCSFSRPHLLTHICLHKHMDTLAVGVPWRNWVAATQIEHVTQKPKIFASDPLKVHWPLLITGHWSPRIPTERLVYGLWFLRKQ